MANLNAEQLRILVVEDDPSYRNLARNALIGHERYMAATARDGLDLYTKHQPDIVFLDLSLPDESGMQLLLKIRAQNPEAFIVMLTSSRLSDDVLLAQRCAANGYVTKPFTRKLMQAYCDACVKHWDKLEEMDAPERQEFREKIRGESEKMQGILQASVPDSKAILQDMMPRWRILLVGKADGAAGEWQQVLQEAGCQTQLMESGGAALERMRDQSFRLIWAEDALDDMDAAELLYRMRVNQHQMPAIVTVDEEWKAKQNKWRKVGATQVVLGPLRPEKVRAIVEQEIARSLDEMDDIFL
ncbi:MAG: response regulator [Alphaproteobacteria bacterium]|nr:response regulator [Alphaproteobacteria bacterium]